MEEPVHTEIVRKLTQSFSPTVLVVENESSRHCVPKHSETHFKVVVVSESFEGVSLIDRHRMVNEALAHELANGVHALSIQAKTPKQWDLSGQKVQDTPACRGGGTS